MHGAEVMSKRLALCLIMLFVASGVGLSTVPVAAQEDSCDAYYQQAGELLRQGQQALAMGDATFALSAIDLANEMLALCAGTVGEPVFFPAGSADRDWTPVTDIFNGVEMVQVPPGCFMMGSKDGSANERPVQQICFDTPFWIDKTEVTRTMYAACVAAGACTEPPASDYSSQDNQPINRVTWFQAHDYCAWQGMQLPTEAQWEYAARGPEGRVYPWGKDFVEDRLVYAGNFDGQTAVVGSKIRGASWVGALDMSGNVMEWVNTIYQDYPYADDGREDGNDITALRVRRGGSFYQSYAGYLRAAKRFYSPPTFEFDSGGFRCARAISVAAQGDSCQARYQQAEKLLLQGQDALANGNVTFALPAINAAKESLAPCVGSVGEPMDFPEGSGNQDWTPVIRPFDGVDMVQVPAGCFMMGSEDGDRDEQPVHQVCFDSPFWMDKTEVTRAMYDVCVAQGVCAETPASAFSSRDNQPINQVTWVQAHDYCVWRGARLPTEAEWEYTARGPDGLIYPQGNEFVGDDVVYGANSSATAEVGSKPEGASWVGALDMSGNVWEWVADWYDAGYYGTLDDGAINPSGPTSGSTRVSRGGSFVDSDYFLRAAARSRLNPDNGSDDTGFRCARSY
jgi:formylglycine-generating enzyme required for sulfatase activity